MVGFQRHDNSKDKTDASADTRLVAAGQTPGTTLDRGAMFGALAAALLTAPAGDETVLRAVGADMAAIVWRRLVLELSHCAPVRRTLLRDASCRYWLRRLADEARSRSASRWPSLPDDDPIWPVWHWLVDEIAAAEREGE